MIFISYASEDVAYARQLYTMLRATGLAPWMDKPPDPWRAEGILPGQDWAQVIDERLNAANYIILLLSRASVAKRGYVSYEFRRALEIMSTMPVGGILVIPVRIDDCTIPPLEVNTIRLKSLHWEDVPPAALAAFVALLGKMGVAA
jgi:hypothetical protein